MPLRDDILTPIPGENPSGIDLRYNNILLIFDQIKEARRQDDVLSQGDWQIPLKTANFPLVVKLAQDAIATISKDLQLAAWLTEALLYTKGLSGLREGLELCLGLLTGFWETVYPRIDDGDRELRAMPLYWIGLRLDSPVRSTSITASGYSWFDYKDSRMIGYEDQVKTDEGRSARAVLIEDGKISPEVFDKSFAETPKAFYLRMERDLDSCIEALASLGRFCDEKFEDDAPSFDGPRLALRDLLQTVHQLLKEKRTLEPDSAELEPVSEATFDPHPIAAAERARVFQLVDDAERLTTNSQFAPALELLGEALKLDPVNAQVKKLRKLVREHREQMRRAEDPPDIVTRADGAMGGLEETQPDTTPTPAPEHPASVGPGEFTRIFVGGCSAPKDPLPKIATEPPAVQPASSPSAASAPSKMQGFSTPGASDSASAEGSFTQFFKTPSIPQAPAPAPVQAYPPPPPPTNEWTPEPSFPADSGSATGMLSSFLGSPAASSPASWKPEPVPYRAEPLPSCTPPPPPPGEPSPSEADGVTRLIQRLSQVRREAPPEPFTPASPAPPPPPTSTGPGEFTRMISSASAKAAMGAPSSAAPPPPAPAAGPKFNAPKFEPPKIEAPKLAPPALAAPAAAPPASHVVPSAAGQPGRPPQIDAPSATEMFLRSFEATPKQAAPKSEGATLVSVFYVTDRMQLPTLTGKTEFGQLRSLLESLHYGRCEVSIPKAHQVGKLETPSILRLEFRPDPRKHIVLNDTFSLEEREFFGQVKASVGKSAAKDAFVFVHGYNVSFEDAARRTGQIAFDLNFIGAPIFYSWPSQGKTAGYTKDETNITWSTPHLQRFLTLLAQNSGAERIHILAHSMGNRAVCDALKMLSLDPACRLKLTHLVLAAPDIDADTFRELAAMLQKLSGRITLYESSRDLALMASKKIHGNPRAGEPLLVIPGLDTIDASAVDTDFLGHSYFSDNWPLLSDIYSILFDDHPPERRFGLSAKEDSVGRYYSFRT